jgi:hypothetical protein
MDDIKTPEELYLFMKQNIKYGFVNDKKEKCIREELGDKLYEEILFSAYYLQSPLELLDSKLGLCFDQVEFERDWFLKHDYKVLTYYTNYHNHVFLIYIDNKYHLFERTIKAYNGIYDFNSLEEALSFYVKKQEEIACKKLDIKLYQYDKLEYGLNFDNIKEKILKI